ncbi:MAG: tRNA-dihydrouridine synthase family protein [Treponema sp.]|nr:tRNA-dihydrouridine synthase family protein [Treponema sp.]
MAGDFLLAPMAELTHRPLRELIESFHVGADEYFTEMISAAALLAGGHFESWYVDNAPCPGKLVYQIVGGETDALVRAVSFLDQKECLGIDINMHCSAPAITRSGAGIRWMADIEKSADLIRRARPKTSRRLSVKLGAGLTDDFEYLARFCRRLEEEGVDLITLHPRTAKEKFKRAARWSYISALRKEVRIPIAGNGDIASAEEMLRRRNECDAVMVGRLAVRRPWIFAELRNIQAEEGAAEKAAGIENIDIEETGLRFLELLSRHQPPEFHISRARRFFGYFCDNLKWGNYVKNLLNREADISGIARAWRGYFAERESIDGGF